MTPLVNSVLIAMVGSALAFITASFWFKKNQAVNEAERLAVEHSRLDLRVHDLEKQLSLVGAAVVPINAAFQAMLIKELTHFHTPEMDALMAKLEKTPVLDADEDARLRQLLLEREKNLNGGIPEHERDAAHILPVVMKRVRAEAALASVPVEIKVVSVVVPEEAEKES